jgi:hypothetical protein
MQSRDKIPESNSKTHSAAANNTVEAHPLVIIANQLGHDVPIINKVHDYAIAARCGKAAKEMAEVLTRDDTKEGKKMRAVVRSLCSIQDDPQVPFRLAKQPSFCIDVLEKAGIIVRLGIDFMSRYEITRTGCEVAKLLPAEGADNHSAENQIAEALFRGDTEESRCARVVMQKIIHHNKMDPSDDPGMRVLLDSKLVYMWQTPARYLEVTPVGYAVLRRFVELSKEAKKLHGGGSKIQGNPSALKIKYVLRNPMPASIRTSEDGMDQSPSGL